MHPDTKSNTASLFARALSILDRLGFSKRAARRRRALTDLRYASEYLKYDIGFYEARLNSPDGEVPPAPSPISRSAVLEQPSLLSCQRA